MVTSKSVSLLKGAMLGGAVAAVVLGLNVAVGQSGRMDRARSIDDWSLKAYKSEAWPAMTFSLDAQNTAKRARNLDITLTLIRQEFKGNPGARVVRPSDYVRTPLETQHVSASLGAGQSKTFTLSFKSKGEKADGFSLTPRISYVLSTEIAKTQVVLAQVIPAKQ
jgi:hypothetical protein